MKPTIGQRLIALKDYSGLSLNQIASRAGYAGASSIQKLFNPAYNPEKLAPNVASRLAKALVGTGDPPIKELEITSLAGEGGEIDSLIAELSHYTHLVSKFIPLFRTKRINDEVETENGGKIPLFVRQDNEEGLHFPNPEFLRGKQLIGLYVTVGNMWPRFEEGEVIFYEHRRPPVVGDDVVLRIVSDIELDGAYVIGRLSLLHEEEVQVQILSPRDTIVLPRKSVISLHRLVARADMLPEARSVYG